MLPTHRHGRAGDSFIGAVLFQYAKNTSRQSVGIERLIEYVEFAGKVYAKVCTKVGAMSSLPTLNEVESTSFTVSVKS